MSAFLETSSQQTDADLFAVATLTWARPRWLLARGLTRVPQTAWLWPFSATQQKSARSWSTQIDLMERYDEYRFVASQAQQFKWLEKLYPLLFKRVTQFVDKGTFQIIGGSWVEAGRFTLPRRKPALRRASRTIPTCRRARRFAVSFRSASDTSKAGSESTAPSSGSPTWVLDLFGGAHPADRLASPSATRASSRN